MSGVPPALTVTKEVLALTGNTSSQTLPGVPWGTKNHLWLRATALEEQLWYSITCSCTQRTFRAHLWRAVSAFMGKQLQGVFSDIPQCPMCKTLVLRKTTAFEEHVWEMFLSVFFFCLECQESLPVLKNTLDTCFLLV